MSLISFVIPCLNEEKNLPTLWERLRHMASTIQESCEFVFVDDGSTDSTPGIIERLAAEDPRVRLVSLSRNFGQEAAIAAGLDHAAGDAVVLMDADLQDPPELIGEMIRRWEGGAQVVYAQRRKRAGERLLKRATAHAYYLVLDRLSDTPIPRNTGNFRLMDRRVADVLRGCRENPRLLRGLVAWSGFRQEALVYDRDARLAGQSGYNWPRMIRLALEGICSFSQVPLRAAIWLGASVTMLSVLGILVIVGEAVFLGVRAERGIPFLTCAVFFMGGIQLLMLGVIGQYVGTIFSNVQGRPLYVVGRAVGFDNAPPRGESAAPRSVEIKAMPVPTGSVADA